MDSTSASLPPPLKRPASPSHSVQVEKKANVGMARKSASKLGMFLTQVPPNEVQVRLSQSFVAGKAESPDDTATLIGQPPNEEPFESPKRMARECISPSSDVPHEGALDPEQLNLPSDEFQVARPQPESLVQVHGIPSVDASGDNTIGSVKAAIVLCLDSIKRACATYADDDLSNARQLLAALADAKAAMAVRHIPQFLGAAVKSFDKARLSMVADAEKAYNFVSIQHVEQAMKIRAFRKTVLPQVFPNPPDNPKQVLADLFPDIVADTIDQMFDACANDLHSCFEVLCGLSDYSTLDTSLSPKASYLRRQRGKLPSTGPEDDLKPDDDLHAPLFEVKGYQKPKKLDRSMVSSKPVAASRGLDDCQFFSMPPPLDDGADTWPPLTPGEATEAFAAFETAQSHLLPSLSFRHVRIFDILDEKRQETPFYAQHPARSRRVLIVGGGPVGLRTAIEVALLGGDAIVVEKRSNFNRENILHLFPWVVHDLTKLGAKVFYRRTSFEAIDEDGDGYVIRTSPPLPDPCRRVSALVGAGGNRDTIGHLVDIGRKSFSPSPAVGAVVIFPNRRTKAEVTLCQFSWAKQYNQDMFAALKADLGVDVENVVYYRDEVHYVVMTPKKASLIDAGVLETKELDSVNSDALQLYVRKVLAFLQIPAPDDDQLDAQLFDFSQTRRAEKAAVVLHHHAKNKLLVALVGDALLEPFWPQGLGINRGFLSALDTAFAVARLDKADDQTLLADHDKHYKACTGLRLRANIRSFNVDPASRYKT
ncbi:hypothetical protein DYB25_004830 [Aphanomyces astaci]|uniref:[F-actin]-monooxygenase MICAL1-3-like Rossman domain-containing protein n=2 Tax=Aphanomyces astaci TaxID=112090 RepID=A0A397AXY6_APHAT|nr:hypothetical protein DYB25_004830 [Aphanomyces astaci]RHY60582.1 hypothetical protein DYB30_006125 [Aphanomyces astaci]